MYNLVKPGMIFTFYNGMIGTVTKGGKLALISPSGMYLAHHRQPRALEYVRDHEPKKIELSYKDPSPMAHKDDVLFKLMWINPLELGIEAKMAA